MAQKRSGKDDERCEQTTMTVTSPANLAPTRKPSPPVLVHIEVIWGGITKVKAPVVIGGLYQGMPLGGPARAFDRLLDSWLTRARDLGMISSGLGHIFLVPLDRKRPAGQLPADTLLLMGAGEPGHLGPDDVRYMLANATIAVKAMRQNHLSTELVGSRRDELSIDRALKSFLQGVLDGYAQLEAMASGMPESQDVLRQAINEPLYVALVENDADKAAQILATLEALQNDNRLPGLQLEVARGADVPPDPEPRARPVDTDPDEPMTLLRVTSTKPEGNRRQLFQYSALTDRSAITVREHSTNPYFVSHLPSRLTAAPSAQDQEAFALFFANYLIPDDIRPVLEEGRQLTLVVDPTTAALPWEMAAYNRHSKTCYFGTDLRLTRQFRTLLSPAPGSPPPLNHSLNVLIIADPAADHYSLPEAQTEGLAVLEALQLAQDAWKGTYDIKVTVRLGSFAETDATRKNRLESLLDKLRRPGSVVGSAAPCDPMELAKLIVNESFDVIHFAGHGICDLKSGRAGWIFDADCILSAQEIFRVRQVPRLVFANACFSAATASERRQQVVGLAQAFFARGIQNYIGTGWEVNDTLAADCARWFYSRALGLRSPDGPPVIGTAPPATLGYALAEAREMIRQKGLASAPDGPDDKGWRSTWGAYQHYGKAIDKLLPLPNIAAPANGRGAS
jgi:hypothetical protein